MSTTPIYNKEVAINAMLYVINRVGRADLHKVFKILYFADQSHLLKYGRTITGDTYIAMEYGPVPTNIYDAIKSVRGDGKADRDRYQLMFNVENKWIIKPLQDADMDYLSVTDIEELNDSISENGSLSMGELTDKSHSLAWNNTELNKEMSIENILREKGADKDYIRYITENIRMGKELCREEY